MTTAALVLRIALGAVLVAGALAKLAAPRDAQAALATFGIRGTPARRAAWAGAVAVELVLGAATAAGVDAAAYAAAALMIVFAGVLVAALRRGQRGRPCACLGARSTVRPLAVARNLVLAAAFAAVPSLDGVALSGEQWLAIGLAVALAGVAALAVVVAALARELGELRLRVGPELALEIEGEGPPLGSHTEVVDRFAAAAPKARFAVAVFSSEGCPLCATLEPAVAQLARDPLAVVNIFDEHRDADVWRALAVPGSPYAVVLTPDGTVRAKGTFNSFGQLQGLLATADTRLRERPPSQEVTHA